jgi:uncharacterized membrane protein
VKSGGKSLNLETSKNLGGVGAILMFIGFIIPVLSVYGLALSLVGLILVLVGLKGLADYYNEAGIFNNFFYGSIAGVVGVVVAGLVAAFAVLTLLSDFLYTLYPTWDGDWSTLPGLTPNTNIVPTDIVPFLMAILLVIFILFVFAIIVALLMRKSLKVLSAKTGVGLFGTTGLLLLIGAVLAIVVIGFLLIWIAMLILAIAFFSIKPQQAQSTTPAAAPTQV